MNTGTKKLTSQEMAACVKALTDENGPSADPKDCVLVVLGAFYRTRFGEAPGSAAVNPKTGQTAMRYYDAERKEYAWVVHASPEVSQQSRFGVQALPGVPSDWDIHENPWWKVIAP